MMRTSSIQLSHELRVYSNLGCSGQHTSMMRKGKVRLVNINLSSHGLRQDAWSLHLSCSTLGPINPIHSKCNVFVCQSVLTPGGGNMVSDLKSAAIVLTRSCDALHGNPIVLKLIPAVAVIAFAAWGLGPLMRLGGTIFLHKSDDSWTKSSMEYVLSSYLQPLMLWTGAILICRALDPVVLPSIASQAVKQRLLNFIRSLSTVVTFAYCLSSLIPQAQKFFAEINDSNDARNMGFNFAAKSIYTAVWIAAVSLFMELLGFSTQKWLTAGGLGTVLLTLAGREIFTNFLSSIMIHATRPFVVNEWIQTKIEGDEVSGTVEHVGWWSPTIIRGDDREAVHIPNHKFTVSVVRNLSQKTHWRIKTHLAISHLDVNKINGIVADMRKVLAKNPQVEQQKLHRRVFLDNINPENQALMILVSCFVKTPHSEEYQRVKELILLDLLRVISHHRARLATPIRTVQKMYNEDDLDNVIFDDTISARSRAAANRPLLLIEPSYKINGDDKAKASIRSVQTNEEEDVNAETSKEDKKSELGPTLDAKTDNAMTTSTNLTATFKPNGNMQDVWKEKMEMNSEDTIPREGTLERSSVTKQESESANFPSYVPDTKRVVDRSPAWPSVARPPLEDNIVLGVALEGSKRTLPIGEETAQSPFPAELKELACRRNGGGSLSSVNDRKEGPM